MAKHPTAKGKTVGTETPSSSGGVGTWPRQTKKFLVEVREEMEKVAWPDPKETVMSTGVIMVFTALISLYLGAVDWVFTGLIRLVMG